MDDGYRSGFVTLVGRPNAGKSTLLNKILGQKVSIVSNKPQTTRTQVRGVLTSDTHQVVFVDTPGIHKPRSALGTSLNATANDAIVVVTKADIASPDQVLAQLAATSDLSAEAWFPVSGRTGEGIDALVAHLRGRLPPGPQYYPDDMVSDVPDPFWVAELVREQLLAVARQELPHSIATRVTEWEWPRVRCEILVERESQKAMVIGKGGENLKKAGTAVRRQLPDGAFVELFVKVEKNWQRRPDQVAEFGY